MRSIAYVVSLVCITSLYSFSQTITTSFSGSSFCAGASFNISYTATGTFGGTNVFTAQLSDALGNFSSPITIGSTASSFSGVITIVIPPAQSGGNAYRIRVVTSSPSVVGTDNGSDITIKEVNLNAPTFAGNSFCPGNQFTLNYSFINDCDFVSGNVFTAQLSDASGSFASPVLLQSTTTPLAGSLNITIPTTTTSGSGYRIRLVSTNPVRASADNGTNLTIRAFGINAPTFSGASFCQGESFTVGYTIQNGCSFPFAPSTNIFSAQLSNASGSFISPIVIGSVTSVNDGFIQATIPVGTEAGSGYRIRIVSSNPSGGIIGTDSGTPFTINSSPLVDTNIFGSGVWSAYVYSGSSATLANNVFFGTYSENNLSFDTQTRWSPEAGPGISNAVSGTAYEGCPIPMVNYSISFKRKNFTCGYYQIDIPFQDDGLTLFVNGTQVFQNNSFTPQLQSNVWTGFLGTSSTVEFVFVNLLGGGRLQAAFKAAPNPLTTTAPVTICSTASAVLNVSSPQALSYSWTPSTSLSPSNGVGSTVTASPSTTTTYTATGTDAFSGCSVSKSVTVTVVPPSTVPIISLTNTVPTICSGVTSSLLTASGAGTYSWSPSTGLSTAIGSTVVANPAVTTTYTVTGSTGCQSATNTATVTVQPTPTNPSSNFGNAVWNVYCHNNTSFSNYYGYYTENNLSFNTTTRWGNSNGPSIANNSSGLAYAGCTFGNTDYSLSFRRTNFTCGYYQINIPFQDDAVKILVNGISVFQNNNFTPAPQNNVWTGFLGPTTTVEIQFINFDQLGQLEISIVPSGSVPQTINSNSTICVGTSANLSATSSTAGATYLWSINDPSNTITFLPNAASPTPELKTTGITPTGDYVVTNFLIDAANSGCTISKSFTLTVSLLPTTSVTPINSTSIVTSCSNAGVALTASGATTYSWSPATGLSSSTGFSVTAKPTVTTTYTVTGSNNCSSNSATATVTVLPLPSDTTFPLDTWHVYGYNSSTIGVDYKGFYTENGFGITGLNFDTRTRWSSSDVASSANASNGREWQGCILNAGGTSLSFKRTGFTCGIYQLDVPSHVDGFALLINGIQVAQHNGCCDIHTNLWTGVLTSTSTVEWQLFRSGAESHLQVAFTLIPQPANTTTWTGSTSNNWFVSSNWCNGLPTASTDVLIPSVGPQNFPTINQAGAVVKNITINPALAASAFTNATAPASVTITAFNFDVYGNWLNNGIFSSNNGTVNFLGSGSGNTISSLSSQTFNNLVINKANGITISGGVVEVKGSLTLTNGVVTQNASLKLLAGATVSGVSNASYIDGKVSKIGNSQFTFPIGKGGLYRPITISAPLVSSDSYTAQYFNVNPNSLYPIAQRASTLDKISDAEYWMLIRDAGSSNVTVTLSWGSNSSPISSLDLLRVAAWNGTSWADLGNGGTSGNPTAGTVSTVSPSTIYGPFALNENKVIIGLEDPLNTFQLYPNPASGLVSIDFGNADELSSLSVLNNIGQEVTFNYATEIGKIVLDASQFTPGVYFIRISTNQKKSILKMMVLR
jgi:Secretion system C-terminal sorting domain